MPIYECIEDDYAKFYPIEAGSKPKLDGILQSKNRKLHCLDWHGLDVEFFGKEDIETFGHVDVSVVPCNFDEQYFGAESSRIDPECDWDFQKAKAYM